MPCAISPRHSRNLLNDGKRVLIAAVLGGHLKIRQEGEAVYARPLPTPITDSSR